MKIECRDKFDFFRKKIYKFIPIITYSLCGIGSRSRTRGRFGSSRAMMVPNQRFIARLKRKHGAISSPLAAGSL